MCCLAIVALISPRLAVILLWLFDNQRMSTAFQSGWIAIIGWLLLPWTTLAWAVCYSPIFGVTGFGYLIVAFAFVVDIMSYVGGARGRSNR